MRKVRLDDASLQRLLTELDAQEARTTTGGGSPFFSYRIPGLRVELDLSREATQALVVPTRKLGPHGVYFLTGSLVHTDCVCRVNLVTVRNNWQTVSGKVAGCRYLPGTNGVHEVFVRFDRPIDPASFAATATRSRILAVDDSPVSQKLYEHLLSTMNVDLTCVSDGVEAVERALADTFDLILMDLEMPRLDGLSAVRMLRGKGYVRAIVAVSALDDPEDRKQCLAAGCDDFLAKPLSRESLAEVVNRNKPEPLVSALLGDPGMTDLIDGFVKDLVERIGRMEAAFGEENMADLEREARALKGEAAGVGFGAITDAAVVLERAIKRAEARDAIRLKLTDLIRLCMAARPATAADPGSSDKKTAIDDLPEWSLDTTEP